MGRNLCRGGKKVRRRLRGEKKQKTDRLGLDGKEETQREGRETNARENGGQVTEERKGDKQGMPDSERLSKL